MNFFWTDDRLTELSILFKGGESFEDMAAYFGITTSAVNLAIYRARKNGWCKEFPLRVKEEACKPGKEPGKEMEALSTNLEQIRSFYITHKYTAQEIADMYDVPVYKLRQFLQENRIIKREHIPKISALSDDEFRNLFAAGGADGVAKATGGSKNVAIARAVRMGLYSTPAPVAVRVSTDTKDDGKVVIENGDPVYLIGLEPVLESALEVVRAARSDREKAQTFDEFTAYLKASKDINLMSSFKVWQNKRQEARV